MDELLAYFSCRSDSDIFAWSLIQILIKIRLGKVRARGRSKSTGMNLGLDWLSSILLQLQQKGGRIKKGIYYLFMIVSIDSFTWDLCGLTMTLNLSMAMVITEREDMRAATQGTVRVSLEWGQNVSWFIPFFLKSSYDVWFKESVFYYSAVYFLRHIYFKISYWRLHKQETACIAEWMNKFLWFVEI